MSDKPYTLRDFVLDQMDSRGMSNREFGKFTGISNTTINRIVNPANKQVPSMDVLSKLARATNTPLVRVIAVAYPGVADQLAEKGSVRDTVLAELFEELPDNVKEVIRALIRGQGKRAGAPDKD